MSFFGFDPTIPKDTGHPSRAPGFGTAPDPFSSIAQHRGLEDDDDAIDFEDTYDGLGDQLEEANDDLNEATFGGMDSSAAPPKPVGKDFDFHGQTAKVSNAINEEQFRFNRQQVPPPKPQITSRQAKPFKTGYEAYENPDYIPDLQVNSGVWGQRKASRGDIQTEQRNSGASIPPPKAPAVAPARKVMSLEEVEAAMQAQAKKPARSSSPQIQEQSQPQTKSYSKMPTMQTLHSQDLKAQLSAPINLPPQQLPYQRTSQTRPPPPSQILEAELPAQSVPNTSRTSNAPQVQPRNQPAQQYNPQEHAPPRQILQNPKRQSAQLAPRASEPPLPPPQQQHRVPTTGPVQVPIITHPQQLMHLSEEDRNAFLVEDAKRAKRNHKIYLLSRDNGLMTPQDKNFITRIQLQQLMTATGNVLEQDADAALAEDFYYQVTSQIKGGARQSPHQPLSNFAQTYLFQTGSRNGGAGRRQNRAGDNHMQRMEMQVQRAVEAAKAKPKNKQLVIEGSLGKISFSNAKTPKPLLNIKRNDSHDRPQSAGRQSANRKALPAELSVSDRKSILRNIEAVYSTLMKMEDHERRLPPPPASEEQMALAEERHSTWRESMLGFSQKLWDDLKVMQPLVEDSPVLHPFIAFLSYPKGKKAIPRIFRHLDEEKRLTILTMIVVHLNVLDVIRNVQPGALGTRPSLVAREEVELFSHTVMPSLFAYVNEAPLQIVIGLLGLILSRSEMQTVLRTKIGLNLLTMLLSRAELVKQSENPSDQEWEQWVSLYNRFFDIIEPILGSIFPGSVNDGQDVYVWQFLAASGIGASPDQQQRLVVAVKDRVMETVMQSKTLPADMASQRLGNVNLFMRAIGLDVELLG